MKSTIVLFVLALIVATVQAVALDTNAERMARGLPPRAPRKLYRNRASAVEQAKRSQPSGKPSSCSTGPVQCCDKVTTTDDGLARLIAGLLGINLGGITGLVGLNCSPISVIGVGNGNQCHATTVCCENNSHGGLISIGCIPIIL